MLKKISKGIVKGRYVIIALFVAVMGFSAWAMTKVDINYNISDYLSKDSDTSIALDIMEKEFGLSGQAEVMVKQIHIDEALLLQARISGIEHVQQVSFYNNATYFNDPDNDGIGSALYKIIIDGDDYSANAASVIGKLEKQLANYEIVLNGQSVANLQLNERISNEMIIMVILAIVIVAVVLFVTSRSWMDPLIFGIAIGAAILINMGTNFFIGEISYIVNSIAAIIQMALSMDYALVLMHNYNEEREKLLPPKDAMIEALARSIAPVSASSITTIAGLAAIMFMTFRIGMDIGLVLVKAIFISMITVFMLMPGVIVMLNRPIEALKHAPIKLFDPKRRQVAPCERPAGEIPKKARPRLGKPSIKGYTSFLYRFRKIIPLVLVVLIGVTFLVQNNLQFEFLEENKSREPNEVVKVFGESNQIIMITPRATEENGGYLKQREMIERLGKYKDKNGNPILKDTLSYVSTITLQVDAATASTLMNIDFGLIQQIFGTYYLEKGAVENDKIALDDFVDFATELLDGDRIISDSIDISSLIDPDLARYIHALQTVFDSLDTEMTVKQMSQLLLSLSQYGIELDLSSKVIKEGISIDTQNRVIVHNGVVYEYRNGSVYENDDKKVGTINEKSRKFTLKSVNYEYDENYVYQVDVVLDEYIALIYGMIYYDNHSSETPKLTLKQFVNYLEGLISGRISSGIDVGIAVDEALEKQISALSAIVNNLGSAMTADGLFSVIQSAAQGLGIDFPIDGEYKKYLYFLYGNYFMKDPLFKSYKLNIKVFVDYIDSLLNGTGGSADLFNVGSMVTQQQKEQIAALNALFSSMETENTAAHMTDILKKLAVMLPDFTMDEAYVRQIYGNYLFDSGEVQIGGMTAKEFIAFADAVSAEPAWAAFLSEDMKSKISGLKYVMLDKLVSPMTAAEFSAFTTDPKVTALTGALGLSQSHINLIYALYMDRYNNYDATTGKGVYLDANLDETVKNLYISSAEYLRFMTEVGPDLLGVSSEYWNLLAVFGNENEYYNYASMMKFLNDSLSGVPAIGGLSIDENTILKTYKLYYFTKNPAQNYDPVAQQPVAMTPHQMQMKTVQGSEVLLYSAKLLNADSSAAGYYDADIYDAQLSSMVNADLITKLIGAHRIFDAINVGTQALGFGEMADTLNGWTASFNIAGAIDKEIVRQVYIMNEIARGTADLNADYKINGSAMAEYLISVLSADGTLKNLLESVLTSYGLTCADVTDALKLAVDDATEYNYAALNDFLAKYYGLLNFDAADEAAIDEILKLGYILYFIDNSQGVPAFADSVISAIDLVGYIEALTTEGSADYSPVITAALEQNLTQIYKLIAMCRNLYENSEVPFTGDELSGHISHMLSQIGSGSSVTAQQLNLVYTMYAVQYNLKSFTGSDATVVYSIGDTLEFIQKLFGGAGAAYDGLVGEFVAELLTVREPTDSDQDYADKKAAALEDITYAVETMQEIHLHNRNGSGFTYAEIAELVNDSMKAILSDTLNVILGGAALPDVVIDPHMIEQVFVKYFADYDRLPDDAVEVKTLMEFVNRMLEENPVIGDLVTAEQHELLNSYNRQLSEGAKMFDGKDYSRVIFVISLKDGSQEAFDFVDTVRSNAAIVYGDDETYFAGNTAALRDISAAFNYDILITSIISIAAILLVILLIYRSLLLPIILILIIQGAIWISFSINVMTGGAMFFMAYIIVTCIQMGATIDYGIILSSNYMEQRKKLGKLEAMAAALKKSLNPIMTSGIIITVAGFTINFVSTSIAISTIGGLLGRGTLISMALVLFFLPAILLLADKMIRKTTLKANFVKEGDGGSESSSNEDNTGSVKAATDNVGADCKNAQSRNARSDARQGRSRYSVYYRRTNGNPYAGGFRRPSRRGCESRRMRRP